MILKRPANEIYQALLHKGVIVRPIAGYGMPNHLHVSIGLPKENDKFFDALVKVLGEVFVAKVIYTFAISLFTT